MSKRTMLGVGVLAVAALVGGRLGGSAGGGGAPPDATARAQSSHLTARSLASAGGVNDMADGLPDALVLTGGGDGGGDLTDLVPRGWLASSPTPASTTVVSPQVGKSGADTGPCDQCRSQQDATFGTPARREQGFETGTPTPTVIISQVTPTADNSGRGQAGTPYAPTKYADNSSDSLEAQVRASVERWFPPAQVETAMRVAYCESRYQPTAAEPGGAHHGVFQLADALHGTVPPDIDGQVRQAAALWAKAGWGAWSCH